MKTSCRDYSRYGVNTLGPLCLWQCFNCFSKKFQLVLDFFSILVLKFFSTFFIELSAGQLKMASKNYSQFLLPASNLYCMILTRHLKAMWYFIGKSMACLVTIHFISKTVFTLWSHDLLVADSKAAKKTFCSRNFGTGYIKAGCGWQSVTTELWICSVKQSRASLSSQNQEVDLSEFTQLKHLPVNSHQRLWPIASWQWAWSTHVWSSVVSHAVLEVGAELCQRNICWCCGFNCC